MHAKLRKGIWHACVASKIQTWVGKGDLHTSELLYHEIMLERVGLAPICVFYNLNGGEIGLSYISGF